MPLNLEVKASINGTQQVVSELQRLRQEYNAGRIGIDEYTSKARPLQRQISNVSNSFNQQRQILLATHPALQTFTRGMSTFAHVASTALSVINALNIANLNTNVQLQTLQDSELELLEARKDLARLTAEGLGEGDILWDIQKQKVDELTKAVERNKKAVEDAARQNVITMVTAWVNIAASVGTQIVSIITMIKVMEAQGKLSALSMRTAFSMVFLPLLIILAGVYAEARVFESLFPKVFKNLQEQIKANWGIDDPTGMIAVAVGAYLGWVAMFNELKLATNATVEFIWDAFRELIKNLSFGVIQLPGIHITGVGSTQDVIAKEKQRVGFKPNEGFNAAGEWVGGGVTNNESLELEVELKALRNQLEEDLSVAESRNELMEEQRAQLQKEIDQQLKLANTNLNLSNDVIDLNYTTSNLGDINNELIESQVDVTQSIDELIKNGIPVNIIGGSTTKYGSGSVVDQTWAANYLSGMGSTTGSTTPNISIPAPPKTSTYKPENIYEYFYTLPKEQLENQIKVMEDYIKTFNEQLANPTIVGAARQTALNSLHSSYVQLEELQKALKKSPIMAAMGFEGMVNRPTSFLAGESGPEYVSIKPLGNKSSGGTTIIQQITVQGSILAERELERISDRALKRDLKRVGF